ncbi:hypothetical protein [Lacrimispora amygdalina]|uniref:hypothetical protein n=1 Tax=Lacrimispora amygdalina TaxID=253257 RepID=UPI000BE365AD|nr:hypothetical protein [Lacrimispora amygdalina]
MITNAEIFISLLINEENGVAKTLKELEVNFINEKLKLSRNHNKCKGNLYRDYDNARNKMVQYLFKLNKKHRFLGIVHVNQYSYLIESIGTYLRGLEIADIIF